MRGWAWAVLVGLGVLLAACGGGSSSSSGTTATTAAQPAAPEDLMVDVGGHKLHVVCQGSGMPTVVIELGVGQSVSQWNATQPELAKKRETCVYERAGAGTSEAGPQTRTAQQVSDELFALIGAAKIPTPLIIVSHSLGGMYTQLFAAQHKDLVAGLVFLDPRTAEFQLGYKANLTPAELQDDAAAEAQAIANETFGPEIAGSDESARQVIAAGGLPEVPVIVLTAGVPFEGQKTADRQFWVLTHQHLAAQAGGEERVVDGAEHEIWRTHSDVVVKAVDEVAART
jgi:pimeloyl-ACP methyl ester carboxylesterase